QDTFAMLESYRIGNLRKTEEHPIDVNDPYAAEPQRYPVFTVHTQKPFNAETPNSVLLDSFITPNDLFYVRNHLPVPR
ncbi:hypothetical protein OFC17_35935, partial [Escherichia coli]|nr:hypothetical protein [Escherichia coli]